MLYCTLKTFKQSNRSAFKQAIELSHFLRNSRGFLLSQEEDDNNSCHQASSQRKGTIKRATNDSNSSTARRKDVQLSIRSDSVKLAHQDWHSSWKTRGCWQLVKPEKLKAVVKSGAESKTTGKCYCRINLNRNQRRMGATHLTNRCFHLSNANSLASLRYFNCLVC